MSYAGDTRIVELRKSNPQGWLFEAVKDTYPDIASRRAGDIIRLRLERMDGRNEAWEAVLSEEFHELVIDVVKLKA
ncbi:hypothetical protein [Asticcacaulis sp. EMRT-3]|uniref:hypothetical protein n=1 Tax=Asticcacaulis sp. EMRT-3 TaxID=3040349 RepID=UPI0024AFA73E|nr:hypothetical protein [Asticcacaulis sp. EMRT-3]MDI7774129.1 hypothetical protein [Asticcacaulis sp. EMRT-3]